MQAMEQYLLSPRDLAGLPYVSRYHVFDTPRLTRFFVVFDVQDRALERWGDAAALRLALSARLAKKQRRVSRLQPPLMLLLRPVRARKGVVVVGARAVTAAVVGNTVVVLAKLAGWGATGSGALLSEAFHSMADLGNQLMLAFGLQRSMRAADTAHPYGYGFEQYVWAMVRRTTTTSIVPPPLYRHTRMRIASILAP